MAKKIKSISTYITELKAPDYELKSSYIEYDTNGNDILSVSYSANDVIETKITSLYNEAGKKIEEKNYSDDIVTEHTTIKRNDNNKIIEEKIVYADDCYSIKSYEWNENNSELTITTIDEDGDQEEKEFMKFDDNDNIIENRQYMGDNQLTELTFNNFDDSNNIINSKEYDGNKILFLEKKFEYDDNNKLIKRLHLTKNKKVIESLHLTYDDKGRVVEQKTNNSYIIKIEYNDDDNSKIEEHYSADNLEYRSISKFDEDELILELKDHIKYVRYVYEEFE